VLFGLGGAKLTDTQTSTFAAGANKPVAHLGLPSLLYEKLVGRKATGDVTTSAGHGPLLDRKLLDVLREDIARLQKGLAAEERVGLDDYLAAIESHDKAKAGVAAAVASCGAFPTPAEGDAEARMASMFRMTALAVRCGVTNVVGITLGNGHSHEDLGFFDGPKYGTYSGHLGYKKFAPPVWSFAMTEAASFITALGPVAGDTVFSIINANGASGGNHHGWGARVPIFVYDGTGTFATGGRYLRSERTRDDVPVWNTVDYYLSVSHAMGAPIVKFNGKGTGPIAPLMA
jgi:hypothetical protein